MITCSHLWQTPPAVTCMPASAALTHDYMHLIFDIMYMPSCSDTHALKCKSDTWPHALRLWQGVHAVVQWHACPKVQEWHRITCTPSLIRCTCHSTLQAIETSQAEMPNIHKLLELHSAALLRGKPACHAGSCLASKAVTTQNDANYHEGHKLCDHPHMFCNTRRDDEWDVQYGQEEWARCQG